MKKLESIQGIRGIAVLLVLFSHLIKVEEKYSSSLLLPDILSSGISGVDIFFVISGFIMVTVTRGRFQNPTNITQFLYHRISRIYPLYWFYATLTLVMLLVNPLWVNHGETGSIFYSFLLLPQSHNLPLLAVSWTLSHEVYFYFIFSLLLFFPERFLLAGLLLWGGIIAVLESLSITTAPLPILMISPLTFEFITGAIIAIIYNKSPMLNSSISKQSLITIFVICILIIIVGCGAFVSIKNDLPDGLSRVLLFGIPASIAVYSLVQAENKGLIIPPWLVAIGNASYSIYLSHVLVLSALGRLFFRPSFERFENTVVIVLLIFFSVLCGLLSYKIIEKSILQWFRKRLLNQWDQTPMALT